MRKIIDITNRFGNVDISEIQINPKSRDEIDKTLRGLQYLFTNTEIRAEILKLLDEELLPKVSKNNGRQGMDLWKILVLGLIRQVSDLDYDKLHNLSNEHRTIRAFLGHDSWEWGDTSKYELQTIKDNVKLLTPELIDKINKIVVDCGHNLLGGKKKDELHVSIDSFVIKTDVHYPTDISLLFDAIRKSIQLTANLCTDYNLSEMRQSNYQLRKIKTLFRKAQKANQSNSPNKEERKKSTHKDYLTEVQKAETKVNEVIKIILEKVAPSPILLARILEIDRYMHWVSHQKSLVERRVLNDEVIPHSEKVHSIFEPHTRWISKGKAGVMVELGLPVTIAKDQHGFILGYKIMETESDVDVAVPLTEQLTNQYPTIISESFDKGFWSKSNREGIGKLVPKVIMPKKGRLNKEEEKEHSTKEFKTLRKKHSAVESSINGLDHTGLSKCYDHGIHGFKRCVSLSILARNIHTLGVILLEKQEKQRRRKRHKQAA